MNTDIDLIALRAMITDALNQSYTPAWTLTPGLSMRRDVDGLVSAEGADLATIPHRHVPHVGRLHEVADAMIADALGPDPIAARDFNDEATAFIASRAEPKTMAEHAEFVLSIENEAQPRGTNDEPTAPAWSAFARWSRIELHMAEFVEAVFG